MGELRAIEMRIDEAQSRWPGLYLKRKSHDEAAGPCPFCQQGKDRFLVFADGGYWCRQCSTSGWLDEKDSQPLTAAELTEIRLRRLEAQQAEQERRLSTLERMHACTDHLGYHRRLYHHEEALEYWFREGMTTDTIDTYQLGWCDRCPTDRDGRPSYTIPVVIRGDLFNIRHRLVGGDQGDKYRPHMSGLPRVLFNADYLYDADPQRILICEGEKKSIIAAQAGFPNVGLMGKSGFDPAWRVRFERFETVYVALDPDAEEQAVEIAALFGGRGRVVQLYDKLDDLIVKHGAGVDDIEMFLRYARKV